MIPLARSTDIMAWVAGRLDKRGSFEDYLLRLAAAVRGQGLSLHVVAGPVWDPSLRAALDRLGVGMTALEDAALRDPLKAARILLRSRPRLLHYHFGSPSSLLASLARALGVPRFVFTDHGSRTHVEDPAALSPATAKRLVRRLRSAAVDLYLPVSEEVAGHLQREIGIPHHKIRRLMNGVDMARYSPCPPVQRDALRHRLFGLRESDALLLYAGQLTPEKGVLDLLAVQDRLVLEHPGLTIAWAGDGPLRAMVQSRANGRIRVLGRRGDVPDLLRAADLVVAPSHWREAFSLILAETAATGVPVVASRIGGIPEVVEDGVSGLLIEPGDRDALHDAIGALLADPDRRRAMGAAARRRAHQLFDLDDMVATTLRHYAALLPPTRPTFSEARSLP